MTQKVLKNEISELSPANGLQADKRREIADAVSNVTADAFRLSLNTRAIHWNVEGPLFYSVHKLTEDQYEEMVEAIDELAERVRALGLPAPDSLSELTERSNISDLPQTDLDGRLTRMIADYERAVKRLRSYVEMAEEAGDIKTADLLTERIGVYDENAWMLRATIAS